MVTEKLAQAAQKGKEGSCLHSGDSFTVCSDCRPDSTCGIVAGKTVETAQQVTGTAAEEAEQGKEKLAPGCWEGQGESQRRHRTHARRHPCTYHA